MGLKSWVETRFYSFYEGFDLGLIVLGIYGKGDLGLLRFVVVVVRREDGWKRGKVEVRIVVRRLLYFFFR